MRSRTLILFQTIALAASFALPVQMAAQHTRYKLIDLGTFGGRISVIAPSSGGPQNPARGLTTRGVVVGGAETQIPDPFSPNCPDCLASHGFRWQHGVLTDLGTLQGVGSDLSSVANWINARGWIAGSSDSGGIDPITGFRAIHPVLWRSGDIVTDLGSLGGTSHEEGINSQGQIVGRSMPTPESPVQHAFLWEHGGPMMDLNTLIPADSPLLLEEGGNLNDRGEIAGCGLPNGCDDVDERGHAFVLIPCDSDVSCENKDVATTAIPQPASVTNKRSTTSAQAPRTLIPMPERITSAACSALSRPRA